MLPKYNTKKSSADANLVPFSWQIQERKWNQESVWDSQHAVHSQVWKVIFVDEKSLKGEEQFYSKKNRRNTVWLGLGPLLLCWRFWFPR